MDVNEEIVKEWLHTCKRQFTIEGIRFKTFGKKGGSNYSNIDILAVDTNGIYYDYEIKWRSVYSIGATDKEGVENFISQMTRPERIETIHGIIGNKLYRKVFVTTMDHFGKTEKKRKSISDQFKNANIELIYFEDIVKDLVEKVETYGIYDVPILQTIRMLKKFGHLTN